jgi:2-C-methyl-D-erythritol 4-phosphate cytidylyltransferase
MSVLAIIPARSGSKEIKNKNFISLKGKKLIQYTIEESLKSKIIDRIYIYNTFISYKSINFFLLLKLVTGLLVKLNLTGRIGALFLF